MTDHELIVALRQQETGGRHEAADRIEALSRRAERLEVQLAGCSVAALGATDPTTTAKPGDYGWSAAYQDVLDLRDKIDALERDEGNP